MQKFPEFLCENSETASELQKLLAYHDVRTEVVASDLDNLEAESRSLRDLGRVLDDQPLNSAITFDQYAR